MAKILIATSSFGKEDPSPLNHCKKYNEVILNPFGRTLTECELLAVTDNVEGIVAGTEKYHKDILLKIPSLKVISRCGAGLDNIDLQAAAQLGMQVYNTPDAPTLAVAELTVGLLLSLLRKVTIMDGNLRRGNWKKEMGSLLNCKKVGFLGFGRIGQRVAELLMPFNVEIAYCDVQIKETHLPCTAMQLTDMLAWANIVMLHCSAPTDGKAIIGEKELGQFKKGTWLVNTSRGGLVDEEALYTALQEERVAGAALDVYNKEPYSGPLIKLENVILTPHIGSYARESRIEMENQAVNNLLEGLKVC